MTPDADGQASGSTALTTAIDQRLAYRGRGLLTQLRGEARKGRADERTRTADRLIASEPMGVAGVAQGCKSPISRPVSLLRLAACCTVLHSQWCQSGVTLTLVSA